MLYVPSVTDFVLCQQLQHMVQTQGQLPQRVLNRGLKTSWFFQKKRCRKRRWRLKVQTQSVFLFISLLPSESLSFHPMPLAVFGQISQSNIICLQTPCEYGQATCTESYFNSLDDLKKVGSPIWEIRFLALKHENICHKSIKISRDFTDLCDLI